MAEGGSRVLVDRDALTRIGAIQGAHGLQGELKVLPETESAEYYTRCRAVFVDGPRGLRHYAVSAWRLAGPHWLIRLEGLQERTVAEGLIGGELLLEDEQLRPLAPGEYFQHDLVGCTVEDETGHTIGQVLRLMDQTAQLLLVVEREGREVLLPMVDAIVEEVDLETRTIRVRPPPGLLELNG